MPKRYAEWKSLLPAVAEDKQRAAPGIFPQAFLRRGPQAVEAHPQVAGRGGDENLEVRVETQHAAGALRR